MLLPYTTLTYYGPAAASVVNEVTIGADLAPKGDLRAAAVMQGVADAPLMRAVRLINRPLAGVGEGALFAATPKGRARFGLVVNVNDLTQDDVAGAVLDGLVENGITVRQAMRLLMAYIAGDASGLGGANHSFKAINGTKTRIAGTVVSGERVVTQIDAE